jgi:hypothetical protein
MRARQASGRIAELEAQIRERDSLLQSWEKHFPANKEGPNINGRQFDQGENSSVLWSHAAIMMAE